MEKEKINLILEGVTTFLAALCFGIAGFDYVANGVNWSATIFGLVVPHGFVIPFGGGVVLSIMAIAIAIGEYKKKLVEKK